MSSQTQSQASISMLGFVPAMVVQYLLNLSKNKNHQRKLPEKQSLRSVVMFADISGFTNLTETLSKIGPEGAEVIAFAINRYMELLVKGIGRSGGDIFKFAGDAMIVVWPPPPLKEDGLPSEKDLETLCKQAIQSALDLQAKLNDTNILENVKLSVKIGFGIGDINIIHVGGVFQRTEYLATGDPLIQAFGSEHCCTSGGQTIVSSQVFEMVSSFFDLKPIVQEGHDTFYMVLQPKMNYAKVKMKADALLIKNQINLSNFELIKAQIKSYMPAALVPFIEIDEERWSSELRRLSIMFVNLGIDLSDAKTKEGLDQIQKVIQTVQKSIYMHEGSLNKLLMDDKGSTLIVVFGLPPMAHQDDATRAILTAFVLNEELQNIKCACKIGIATGNVFAGVVGTSGSRREYSVLGDSVNLAARLMQTACSDPQYKIIICQDTASDSEHKISSIFYKMVQLKGKANPLPIFVPLKVVHKTDNPLNYFPDLRTHRHSLPPIQKIIINEKEETYTFTEAQLKSHSLFMVGREEEHRRIQVLVDKFMKGVEKKGLVTVRGTFGGGKTLLVRKVLYRIQEKINSNQYNAWKYGEKSRILVQSVGPISKGQKLCGVRSILRGFLEMVAGRRGVEADSGLVRGLVEDQNTELLEEVVGLKRTSNFASQQENSEKKQKMEYRRLKKQVVEVLGWYFEDVPAKYGRREWQRQEEGRGGKGSNIVAPVLICCDDMQNYDELSFKILRVIVKSFERVMVVGLIRDGYLDHNVFRNPTLKKSQEETYAEGVQLIENDLDQSQIHTVVLKSLQRADKEDEMLKLIRIHFHITSFKLQNHQNHDSPLKKPNLLHVESVHKDFYSHYLFHENKQVLFEKDVPLLFSHFLFIKSGGNPHLTINLLQSFINQKLIRRQGDAAIITNKMLYLLDNEELLNVEAPLCRIQVNGPIIDRLTCFEQLLIKAASVIGDIFDIQILSRILPFKGSINQEKLIQILNDLQDKDIIELMNITDYNTYYRFTHPFFRECIYQRMIYSQRRQIHLNVAETMQMMPTVFETEEERETKILEYNWNIAEQKWSLSQDNPDHNLQKGMIKKDEFRIISHKALRSMVVKEIQNKLSKSFNDSSTIIKQGYLFKKSDRNITWASRYCVMDSKEFKYYYLDKEASNGSIIPLCSFSLKNIYSILPLNENEKVNRCFAFQLNVNSWNKKTKEMGERKFYFAAIDEESLEQWTIFLDFARAKAIYDEFVNTFGKIQFPIGSYVDCYDMAFKNDVQMKKRFNYSTTQIQEKQNNSSKKSIMTRNSRSSKYMLHKAMKFQQNLEEQQDKIFVNNIQDLQLLKERIQVFISKSTLLFYSHLFDMSIQRQDEYKTFGDSNYAMRKLNHVFKVDRKLFEAKAITPTKTSQVGEDEQKGKIFERIKEEEEEKEEESEKEDVVIKKNSYQQEDEKKDKHGYRFQEQNSTNASTPFVSMQNRRSVKKKGNEDLSEKGYHNQNRSNMESEMRPKEESEYYEMSQDDRTKLDLGMIKYTIETQTDLENKQDEKLHYVYEDLIMQSQFLKKQLEEQSQMIQKQQQDLHMIQEHSYVYPDVTAGRQIKKKVVRKKKNASHEQLGTATKNVQSIAGDRFWIERGQRVLFKRKQNGFIEVYFNGKVGLFESDQIELSDEQIQF